MPKSFWRQQDARAPRSIPTLEMSLTKARKVLICLRYGIGDLVMQLPAISELRRQLTEAHITAVGSRPAIDLLEGDARVDQLVNVHDFGLTHWGDYGNDAIRSAIRSWLHERHFDLIIDPSHATMAFGMAVWDTTPAALLDTGNGLEDSVLENGVSGLGAIREAVRIGWGVDVPGDRQPELPIGKEERNYARALLQKYGMGDLRPFAVSPVASSPLKRWPVESVAAAARRILDQYSDSRVLILSGDQEDLGRSVERSIGSPRKTRVVPPTDLRRTGAIIEQCRAFLCNDTGLMHLSAAVGTPTVAVFGPTSPAIYRPPETEGLGGDVACPHRLERAFGPPRCVVEARCLTGRRSCIDEVRVEMVCDTLMRVTRSPYD